MKKKLDIGQTVRVEYGPYTGKGIVKQLCPSNIVVVTMILVALGETVEKDYAFHSSQLFTHNIPE